MRDAVQDGDRRRHGAAGADGALDLVGGDAVVRAGQPMGEQGALQRDDGPAGAQGVRDLGGQDGAGGKGGRRGMHPVIMDGREGRTVTPGVADGPLSSRENS